MQWARRQLMTAVMAGGILVASMSASAFWGWGPFGMFPGGLAGPWSSPWSGFPYHGYGYPHDYSAPYGWGAPLYTYPGLSYPGLLSPWSPSPAFTVPVPAESPAD
jgi:hypothetical protein